MGPDRGGYRIVDPRYLEIRLGRVRCFMALLSDDPGGGHQGNGLGSVLLCHVRKQESSQQGGVLVQERGHLADQLGGDVLSAQAVANDARRDVALQREVARLHAERFHHCR